MQSSLVSKSFLCTQKHCTTVARSGKSCGACYTHGQLVNFRQAVKRANQVEHFQRLEVQDEITSANEYNASSL